MGPSVRRPVPGVGLKFGRAPLALPVVDLASTCWGGDAPGLTAFPQVSSLVLFFLMVTSLLLSLILAVVYLVSSRV